MRVRLHAAAMAALVLGCAARPVAVAPPPAAPPPAGPAVFRRLTLFEYRNTVRDLLGLRERPAVEVPVDTISGKSGFSRGGWLSWVGAGTFLEQTEALARQAVAELPGLVPCDPALEGEAGQRACAERFITHFGRR